MSEQLFRATILHFPTATCAPEADFTCFEDGALIIKNEKIVAVGEYDDIREHHPHAEVYDHRGRWLIPGLIDSHLHYPQTEMLGQYGKQLLQWLENFTFPTENKFANPDYATKIAKAFFMQMLKNGTTTGLVFSSVHKQATDILFQEAARLNMALVAGKVCMDRNCPEYLQDTAQSAQRDSAALIEKWHSKGRSYYAITPRFAPTSTREQMTLLGELAQQYPDTFIQTHLSENPEEVKWVESLYPELDGYLAVYDHYGLVRRRSVFGHCLHLKQHEWQRLAEANATIAFCPSSNLFLGSGLFDLTQARKSQVAVVLATDIGAGTGFNMLQTYGDGYKVCQLRQTVLSPLEGLYMMTQGAAVAHQLDHSIGNLNPGTHADFVIIEPRFNELMQLRLPDNPSAEDMLFALSMLGDERATVGTWVAGKRCYRQEDRFEPLA